MSQNKQVKRNATSVITEVAEDALLNRALSISGKFTLVFITFGTGIMAKTVA